MRSVATAKALYTTEGRDQKSRHILRTSAAGH